MTRTAEQEFVTVSIPRSALTLVSAPPTTVTQRTCMQVFGISKADFLRMAGKKFPVKAEGQLRVARYDDVKAFLEGGALKGPRKAGGSRREANAVDPLQLLMDAGARRISR